MSARPRRILPVLTNTSPNTHDWRQEAACAGQWDVFDLIADGRADHALVTYARRLCEQCPVVVQCAADAQTTGDWHMFRAGLTPSQRSFAARPGEHGTEAGAKRHRDAGERECEPCRQAARSAERHRYQAKRIGGAA